MSLETNVDNHKHDGGPDAAAHSNDMMGLFYLCLVMQPTAADS